MRRTLPARNSLGTAPRIRAWVILIMLNLTAILLVVVFAGIVYHRLVFDLFSPPVYSIFVRPGEMWHHAEFTISPSYGFDVAIDGRSVLFNYSFRSSSNTIEAKLQQDEALDRWCATAAPGKIGMTVGQVIASQWGRPDDRHTTTTASHRREQWVYNLGALCKPTQRQSYLYFDDGVLTTIQD
jgi:hypothetical protein